MRETRFLLHRLDGVRVAHRSGWEIGDTNPDCLGLPEMIRTNVMLFACPHCKTRYGEPVELLARHGFLVLCYTCRRVFEVHGQPPVPEPPVSLDAFAVGEDPFDETTPDEYASDELMAELVGVHSEDHLPPPEQDFSELDQDMFNDQTREASLTPEMLARMKPGRKK